MENVSNPIIYGRYDLFDEHHIAEFFNTNGINLECVPDEPMDCDVDHIGEYILGHAGYRLDGYWFKDPTEAFHFVISHQFAIMGWMAFIANHTYHTTYAQGAAQSNTSDNG